MVLVSAPNAAAQTVNAVVGDANRFLFIFVRDDDQYWAKNFFFGQGICGLDPQDCWLHKVACLEWRFLRTTSYNFSAFFDTLFDEMHDPIALGSADQGAKSGVFIQTGAQGELGDSGLRQSLGFFVAALKHQHTGVGRTGLSAVEHAGRNAAFDSGRQICVFQNNAGRFATELQGDTLDALRSQFANALTRAGRSCEAHHIDLGVTGQNFTHFRSGAIDQVENTRWQTAVMDDFGQDHGVDRRDFTGL